MKKVLFVGLLIMFTSVIGCTKKETKTDSPVDTIAVTVDSVAIVKKDSVAVDSASVK